MIKIHLLLGLITFFLSPCLYAQFKPSAVDTVRVIQIIRGNSQREFTVDSVTRLETLSGNVMLREGKTLFTADSVVLNTHLNTIEAFGNVHINDADTLNTYSQYLKYIGNTRLAYLKRNVKLTDRKGTLTTNDLEYDLRSGIGKYKNGGKVINGKTVLTSDEGTYYSDLKQVFFRRHVKVTGSKTITADSLIYNTQTEKVNFTGPTNIKSKEINIFTTEGSYDLKTGNAIFVSRTSATDSSHRFYQADKIAMEGDIVQMEGNAIVKDSANGIIVTGNQIFLNKKDNSFQATRKPVVIIKQNKDSTYISADTIFSGFLTRIKTPVSIKPVATDTTVELIDSSSETSITDATHKADSITNLAVVHNADSSNRKEVINRNKKDSESASTKINTKKGLPVAKDPSLRFFQAFHHVRIFNDSLQSVCDSMFYSDQDSIFRLFRDPVIWSAKSQVTGDTIYIFTKNRKAERLYVFNSGMIINRTKANKFNQMAGKTINGYLKDGSINYVRVKGTPAESIYYVQDKDSAFVGLNRASGDVIDLYFLKEELNKVKFVNDVKGKLIPMRLIPDDQKYLKNFQWLEKRRPKNKLELFE